MSKVEPLLWCPNCSKYKVITLTGEILGKVNEIVRYGYCNICDCDVAVYSDTSNNFDRIEKVIR